MKTVNIDNQMKEIIRFLSIVHPSILSDKKNYVCLELRPILRTKEYDYGLSKSLNIWNLNDKTIDRLRNFLEEHNGVPCCLYYSVYAFNYDKQSYTKEGKPSQKGKINSENAVYTEEIVLDFDDVSEDEYRSLVDRFEAIGLYGLWVFTGHGYQSHILLNRPLYDKNILFQLVNIFNNKGFNVDTSCTDPARVMRIPYTFNCKCYTDIKYKHEIDSPPFCEIVQETTRRYDIEEITEALKKVPNIDNESGFNNQEVFDIQLKKVIYPYIDNYEIPEPIHKMLTDTPVGLRNKTLGFLVRYFKTYLKLSKKQIQDICEIWNKSACEIPYENFNEDFSRFYYKNGLTFDTSLASHFGYIDFQDYIQLQKQYILIPNDTLLECEGKFLRVYLAIKMLEHIEKPTTIDNIAQTLKLTVRAVRTTLLEFSKTNHIYIVKGNRTKGIPNQYFTAKILNFSNGYLKMSFNDARAYIEELGNSELKLYLFMSYKFFSGECYMSQSNIGKNIGLKQNTISEIVQSLKNKYYIKIERIDITEFIYYNNYTLLK